MRFATLMKTLAILAIILLLQPACGEQDNAGTEFPEVENHILLALPDSSNLLPYNITGKEPEVLVVGGSAIPYQDFITRNRTHEIWVSNESAWVQTFSARQGDLLNVIAYSPSGGRADLYLISYSRQVIDHRGYDLLPGYYHLNLSLPEPGRTMIILAVKSQPANSLIIDVLPAETEQQNGPWDVSAFSPAKARVTIESEKVKGYDVYVDGAFYASDLMDGCLDGVASFEVSGGRIHVITISKRGERGAPDYRSEHRKSFEGGLSYTLRT